MTADYIRQVAYDESGHAVAAALLGILKKKSVITIVPDPKGVYGSVSFSREARVHDSGRKWSAQYARKIIMRCVLGPQRRKSLSQNWIWMKKTGIASLT